MLRFVLASLAFVSLAGAASLPAFRQSNIVSGLKMGYQLVLADLNRDGKVDVIIVDEGSTELAWHENPGWQRHVLARNVPRVINLECQDLNGDGIPEIVMAHHFETNPDRSEGNVLLLEHDGDPRQLWKARELDRVPTAHRLRWIPVEKGKAPWLLVAPLVGSKTYAPDYVGIAPIYAFRPGEWKRMTISNELHGILHSIAPVEWHQGEWQLLTASFDGIERLEPRRNGLWKHVPIGKGNPEPCPRCGSSEVKMGFLGKQRFLATIEPWHGNQVAVYLERGRRWDRAVIDDGMLNGHALAVADLDGDGRDEIVSGFRGKGFRVSVYQASDREGRQWARTVLDEGGVAAADCKIGDINGDGRPDIVCSGASTGNVMLFENLGAR
ncbi:MAG: VCBS repeat-containing protein [Bryobacterales bacterium]|nr:VCBS repeat-containing protein [Bryobacterales bacterium]